MKPYAIFFTRYMTADLERRLIFNKFLFVLLFFSVAETGDLSIYVKDGDTENLCASRTGSANTESESFSCSTVLRGGSVLLKWDTTGAARSVSEVDIFGFATVLDV